MPSSPCRSLSDTPHSQPHTAVRYVLFVPEHTSAVSSVLPHSDTRPLVACSGIKLPALLKDFLFDDGGSRSLRNSTERHHVKKIRRLCIERRGDSTCLKGYRIKDGAGLYRINRRIDIQSSEQ